MKTLKTLGACFGSMSMPTERALSHENHALSQNDIYCCYAGICNELRSVVNHN